jgi:hypothetical protein
LWKRFLQDQHAVSWNMVTWEVVVVSYKWVL